MTKCTELKEGAVFECPDCGLQIKIVKECNSCEDHSCDCSIEVCDLRCCDNDLVAKE